METFFVWKLIQHYIPADYMPPFLVILAALVALEQWLSSTNRIKANSTLQLIVNIAKAILAKGGQNGQGNGVVTAAPQGSGTGPGLAPGKVSGGVSASGVGVVNRTVYEPPTRDGREG